MAILDGCEEKYRTPVPEDRICPNCGKEVEVFTIKGRIAEESKCECGYTFEVEPALVTEPRKEC